MVPDLYLANSTLECLTSVYYQNPFALNIWYNNVVYFPFTGAGYFSLYPQISITLLAICSEMIFISTLAIILKLTGQPSNWIFKDLITYLVLAWQLYVGLSLLLTVEVWFSTATVSTQLVHIFLEITLLVYLGLYVWRWSNQPYDPDCIQINRVGWLLALIYFVYFQVFHSTSNLQIQENFNVLAILTDLAHPVLVGFYARKTGDWLYLSITIVHWLSFYPTIPFCWLPYPAGVYTVVLMFLNMFLLTWYAIQAVRTH